MPGRPKRVVASTGSSNTGAKSPPVANSDANERTTLPNTPAFSGNRDDDENKLKQQPPAFQQDPSLPLPAAREDGTEVDHEEVTVQEGTDERKRSSRQSASSHDRGRRPTPDPTGEEDQEKSQMEGAACVEDEEGPGLLKSLSYIVSIVTDHIDDEQEKIFHLRDNRPVHFAAMNHFWEQYPYRNKLYGRLYTRSLLAEILFRACAEAAYGNESVDLSRPTEEDLLSCLVLWTEFLWGDLITLLKQARTSCLRKDSNILVDADTQPKPGQRKALASLKVLVKSFDQIIISCEVNKALAPIRLELEKQVDEDGNGPVTIEHHEVVALFKKANEAKNAEVRKQLQKFFVNSESELAETQEPKLRDLNDIRILLESPPIDLEWGQRKIESLVQKLVLLLYSKHVPYLKARRYRWPLIENDDIIEYQQESSGTRKAVQQHVSPRRRRVSAGGITHGDILRLRKNRELLSTRHGADPIVESRAVAEQIGGSAVEKQGSPPSTTHPADVDTTEDEGDGPRDGTESQPTGGSNSSKKRKRGVGRGGKGRELYEKKKSAKRLKFDDDELEQSDDDGDNTGIVAGRVELPASPDRRVYSLVPKNWAPDLPTPDHDLFDDTGRVLYRRQWSEEEKTAVKDGVAKYGPSWVQIKQHYAQVLRNRTNVQCKDCYRTMLRTGQI